MFGLIRAVAGIRPESCGDSLAMLQKIEQQREKCLSLTQMPSLRASASIGAAVDLSTARQELKNRWAASSHDRYERSIARHLKTSPAIETSMANDTRLGHPSAGYMYVLCNMSHFEGLVPLR